MKMAEHVPYAPETDLIKVQAAILCSHTGYLLLLMQELQQQCTPSPGCNLQRPEHTLRSKVTF
jgi:hypothetical protein